MINNTVSPDVFCDRVFARLGAYETARPGLKIILAYALKPEISAILKNNSDSLAYVFATIWHETAKKCAPVTEMGSEEYLRSKPYWPYIGRGLIQITWKSNYEKFGVTTETALLWPNALDVAFRGMCRGMFTGVSLSRYFGEGKCDPINARRIINGLDRAQLIASYFEVFRHALTAPVLPAPVSTIRKAPAV